MRLSGTSILDTSNAVSMPEKGCSKALRSA
jgi:hypothetical protein